MRSPSVSLQRKAAIFFRAWQALHSLARLLMQAPGSLNALRHQVCRVAATYGVQRAAAMRLSVFVEGQGSKLAWAMAGFRSMG